MADPYATPSPPRLTSVPPPVRPAERKRVLTEHEQTAVVVAGAMVAALGLLGFVNSFARVAAAARASFGWFAFTVPIGIDLGIAVFSALDIVLARLDMRVRWLRLIPWSLTGATAYLNVATETTAFGRIAHAVLPGLWVIAVEVGAHVVKVRAGIEAGTRMDTVRASRWLLSPWPTAKLWRRMVLWEERSYPTALGRERDRLLALTDLQDTYGAVAWRWKAPRRVRALYRLGELAPVADRPELDTLTPLLPVPVADTRPALQAASGGAVADTSAGEQADMPPTPARHSATRTADTRPSTKAAIGKARMADRQADKARALLSADPEMTGAELGRRLKVSERTGLRLRTRILAELDEPTADTTTAPDTTTTARSEPATVEGADER
ncbi:DUF2637 domain-containing protein [Actinoallomurus purpureus]|uniref:DUF2637 domain-containing protein n=1 Tax=Actinoallomurus purpureus TaxID=478114 RepID=UPI0020937E93|nr:DUF2637 domain-containing protein [Actinoallomurus purpureus]MCO6010565.1 DUF2637 domain-containing protein [Actinoallomurus purpureus]